MTAKSIVHRAHAVRPLISSGHRPAVRGRRAHAHGHELGTLVVHIVTGSILDHADPRTSTAVQLAKGLFDVILRPARRGRAKATVLPKQSNTLELKRAPGIYRIDVRERVPAGSYQKFPDGAAEAVVHPGKTTTAVVVLANDTLRAVAKACRFRIGTLVNYWDMQDATLTRTFANEFGIAAVCIPWKSVQPATAPPGTPHAPAVPAPSAPLISSPPPAGVDAALYQNGWTTNSGGDMWEFAETIKKLLTLGVEIMPTPLSWFTSGESPDWWKRGVSHNLATDHLQAVMRYVRWLGANVGEYVAVNELEDTDDTELWGGFSNHAHHGHPAKSLGARLAETAHEYLTIANHEHAGATFLVNDYQMEFVAPPRGGGAMGSIRREYNRSTRYFATMAAVHKDHGLRGRVGAGYQMHFQSGPTFLGAPGAFRTALQNGIRRLASIQVKTTITEMAVTALPFLATSVDHMYQGLIGHKVKQPAYDPTPGSAWSKFEATLAQHYGENSYAAKPRHPAWKKQAQVFRQIVATALEERSCDTVVFWGMSDKPTDNDIDDLYGHLFDTACAQEQANAGAYPDGPGCPRKPAYFGVLNGLIDAGHALHGEAAVPNWLRRF
jgi:hypothetical protein